MTVALLDRVYRLSWTLAVLTAPIASVAQAQVSANIQGTVRDQLTERPLSGVTIRIDGPSTKLVTRSAEDGKFRFPGVPSGTYELTARRLGYAEVSYRFRITTDTTIALSLLRSAGTLDTITVRAGQTALYGAVGSERGLAPLNGASVQVLGAKRSERTDSAGRFFILLDKAGTFMVRMSAADHIDAVFTVQVLRGHAVDS